MTSSPVTFESVSGVRASNVDFSTATESRNVDNNDMPPAVEKYDALMAVPDALIIHEDNFPEEGAALTSLPKRGRGRPKKIPASGRPSQLVASAANIPNVATATNRSREGAENDAAVLPAANDEGDDDEIETNEATQQLLQDAVNFTGSINGDNNGDGGEKDNSKEDGDDQKHEEPPSVQPATVGKKRTRMTQLEKLLQDQETKSLKSYHGDERNASGRPKRKASEVQENEASSIKKPRGAGRPEKIPEGVKGTQMKDHESQKKRGRGRPKKAVGDEGAQVLAQGGRGLPKRSSVIVEVVKEVK
jgi:hypothetical protein